MLRYAKGLLVIMAMVALVFGVTGCGGGEKKAAEGTKDAAAKPVIGVAIYKYDDTFMTGVRNVIKETAEGKAELKMVDSKNDQPTQSDQVKQFITQKVNSMAINPVDLTAAGNIIDQAKTANIPTVFFNREPSAEDMKKWDKVYYVGTEPKQAGEMEAKILIDYVKANPSVYRSKDNVLHIIILEGEKGHQDAVQRTKYALEALKTAGINVDILAQDTAKWDRVIGQEKMAAFLAAHGDKIDAVIANNDDMALGAIEALKAKGYFSAGGKYIPVVGVDATAPAIKAMEDGTMLGTVLNDAKNQGKATINIAIALAKGEAVTKETTGYDIGADRMVRIPYKIITKANIAEAK